MVESKLRYMVSPLELTERQLLIYQKLYEKCNFTDMTVKYTIEQLRADIRIVDIDINAIYRDIKLMIKKEYLTVIIQGRKGNPSIYKIAKIDDLMRKLNENYVKPKRKLKASNSNGLNGDGESYVKPKRKLSESPIKDKDKDKEIYIYSSETNEYRLSLLLKDLIINRDSKSRAKDCDLQKWCIHIDRLIRLDERTSGEVEKVIMWCQNDSFWCSNILSAEKLRKQFDTLYQQMKLGKQKNRMEVTENGGTTRFYRKSL